MITCIGPGDNWIEITSLCGDQLAWEAEVMMNDLASFVSIPLSSSFLLLLFHSIVLEA